MPTYIFYKDNISLLSVSKNDTTPTAILKSLNQVFEMCGTNQIQELGPFIHSNISRYGTSNVWYNLESYSVDKISKVIKIPE